MKFQTKSSNLKRLGPKSNTLKLGNKIHVTFDPLTHRLIQTDKNKIILLVILFYEDTNICLIATFTSNHAFT